MEIKKNKLRFFINIFVFISLLINIKFLLKKKNIYIFHLLKNIDIFSLGISIKKYSKILHFLSTKFYLNERKNHLNNKRNISILNVDFLSDMKANNLNYLKHILKDDFIIDFNNTSPDYLFYDVFGCEHLNQIYNNSIKIAFYSENMIPDFNQADYALSQSHISYLDRYYKYPSVSWRLNQYTINTINKKRRYVKNRTKFCVAMISNNFSSDNFRLHFIEQLNKYKKVDMAGKSLNNIGKIIENKIEFLSSYKFSIAMENSEGDGYVSEKIIDSFISGTIPIYYGDYRKSNIAKNVFLN